MNELRGPERKNPNEKNMDGQDPDIQISSVKILISS